MFVPVRLSCVRVAGRCSWSVGDRLKTKRVAGGQRSSPHGRRLRICRVGQSGLDVGAVPFRLCLGVAVRRPNRRTGTTAVALP